MNLIRSLRRAVRHTSTPGTELDGYDEHTAATIEAVAPYTMTSSARVAAVCEATRYLCRFEIPGDVVECGVWRGGSMMAIARTLIECGQDDRDLYLFDTFEGMTEPTHQDWALDSQRSAERLLREEKGDPARVLARASLDEVRTNLESTGYPAERLHFVKGPVEETLPGKAPARIALLRLDTDWYESTKHELEHLPRLVSQSGVLIIDDYGHWSGAKQATDEWLEAWGRPVMLNRIDYTGRLAVLH